MMRSIYLGILAALIVVACACAPKTAPACAIMPPSGKHVEIVSEAALIVWDAATHTEHFIRKASFQSASADFGFLVPSPSRPELAESDDSVFEKMSKFTAPKEVMETVRVPRPRNNGPTASVEVAAGISKSAMPSRVEVLEKTEVSGYEAVVLRLHRGKTDDPKENARELVEWLKKRNYNFGPETAEWLKPYIANDWVLTAFRIARQTPASTAPAGKANPPREAIQSLKLKPVRMTFKTDRPFYPYREPVLENAAKDGKGSNPSAKPAPRRFLRVFFLSRERVSATLGIGKTNWVGKSVWSDQLTEEQAKQAAEAAKLPTGSLFQPLWLTEFEDPSTPRKGTDEIYFHPSEDKSAVHRPPVISTTYEYYDVPDENGTPYFVKFILVVGGGTTIGILLLLLSLMIWQKRS